MTIKRKSRMPYSTREASGTGNEITAGHYVYAAGWRRYAEGFGGPSLSHCPRLANCESGARVGHCRSAMGY